jgi:hypothetical protein
VSSLTASLLAKAMMELEKRIFSSKVTNQKMIVYCVTWVQVGSLAMPDSGVYQELMGSARLRHVKLLRARLQQKKLFRNLHVQSLVELANLMIFVFLVDPFVRPCYVARIVLLSS